MEETTDALWHYDEIAANEPERATRLMAAPDWATMLEMVALAFRKSLPEGTLRFGFDESGRNADHLRAVLQFPVGEQLYDWFFNSRTGYRAQFRRGSIFGSEQNRVLIERLRIEFDSFTLRGVSARRLSSRFDDLGPMTSDPRSVITSLDPSLSKVWFCERRIGNLQGVEALRVFRATPDQLLPTSSTLGLM